jgi:carbon storage regulator
MLVLTRNIGQSFFIEGGIKISLLAITGKQARIGIDAPKNINIVREELCTAGEPPTFKNNATEGDK